MNANYSDGEPHHILILWIKRLNQSQGKKALGWRRETMTSVLVDMFLMVYNTIDSFASFVVVVVAVIVF